MNFPYNWFYSSITFLILNADMPQFYQSRQDEKRTSKDLRKKSISFLPCLSVK